MKLEDLILEGEVECCVGMLINLPLVYKLPCGNKIEINSPQEWPTKDTPCPCGNPNHWLIKYKTIS